MTGVQTCALPIYLRKMVEGKRSDARRVAASTGELDEAARGRWERLRAWRAATAKEHGVPAYVVFHDATLAGIARTCPQTLDELAGVSGVGAAKLERYGSAILNLLGNMDVDNSS